MDSTAYEKIENDAMRYVEACIEKKISPIEAIQALEVCWPYALDNQKYRVLKIFDNILRKNLN